MRLALILFGISYVESIEHWTGNFFKVDYSQSINNYKEYIWKFFKNYNIDVFFSTYKSEKSNQLLKDYSPKSYNFYPSLSYITKFKRIGKNSNVIKSIELAINYSEKKKINYDFCILTRFDLNFQIPFEKTKINLNMFNSTSELERSTRICDNFYAMPGYMLKKFHMIVKNYGISANHHFLKSRLIEHFKINYIQNDRTHVQSLSFYKIVRINTNIKPVNNDDPESKNFYLNNKNNIVQQNKIKKVVLFNSNKGIVKNIKNVNNQKKILTLKSKKILIKEIKKITIKK